VPRRFIGLHLRREKDVFFLKLVDKGTYYFTLITIVMDNRAG